MKSLLAFSAPCIALIFIVGCDLDGSGGGSDDSDLVATRAQYTTIADWDGDARIATLGDGLIVFVPNGTFQRDSCSWQDTPTPEFLSEVRDGQLVYYRVLISRDNFMPTNPLVADQFTVVNLDCWARDNETCGPVIGEEL